MKNYRINTSVNGSNRYINVNLEQNFDFLEILSLKLSQEELYKKYTADYGTVVGRSFMNGGLGIPNVKVSIFIKVDAEDKKDFNISTVYPYNTPLELNSEGVRYNILPKDNGDVCYTPVGSLPNKNNILDNDKFGEIYDKYYRFTTTTNNAGDFMFFGVPVGSHTILVDADLSDIGIFSQRPYDFIEEGSNEKLFESTTKFKSGTNLNRLSQIKSQLLSVDVLPFWGDSETNQIGINRLDIDLGYDLKPTAIFMGSIFGDNEKNSVNKNCQPRKKLGNLCETIASEGIIEMIRESRNGQIEKINIDGGRVIDENGAWAYRVPMNLDYVTTNENGDLIPTDDITKGIPTRANVRFKISMDESGGVGRLRTRAKFLVPHNPDNINEEDYSFGDETKSKSFRSFYWNKIYTVRNHITRVQASCNGINCANNRQMIGIKDVDNCIGTKNPFPYNKLDGDFNPLFSIICILLGIIISIVGLINNIIIGGINAIIRAIRKVTKRVKYVKCITLLCNGQIYAPRCGSRGRPSGTTSTSGDQTHECYKVEIAEALNVFEFDFYNDWVNGTLFSFLLKYKKNKNKKGKFCDLDSSESMYIVNTIFATTENGTGNLTEGIVGLGSRKEKRINSGIIKEYDGELFYGAYHKSGHLLFPTDIYELGAVFNCDWQGKPKINDLLIPTSYLIPPKLNEEDGVTEFANDGSPHGLLFDFSCLNMKVNSDQVKNINRICEIGVGLDEDRRPDGGNADKKINDGDIENKYLRDVLIYLNQSPSQNINPENYINSNFDINSGDYWSYRRAGSTDVRQFKGNSLYFYFGTKPGLTSLEKMNSKYFTKCIQNGVQPFIVEGVVSDVTNIGGSDGSITITNIIGGTAPFSYEWSNGYTSQNLTNLPQGEYILVVTDYNGDRVRKLFTVSEPKPIIYDLTGVNLTSFTTNNGKVIVTNIFGGNQPYSITISGPSGTQTINGLNVDGYVFNDLAPGTYTVTVFDSTTSVLSLTKTVTITTPKLLKVSVVKTDALCYGEDSGTININIITGNPIFTVMVTSPNAYVTIINALGEEEDVLYTSSDLDNYSLPKGIYNILVTDMSLQEYNTTVEITEPSSIPIIRDYENNNFWVYSPIITNNNLNEVVMYLNGIAVGSPIRFTPSIFSSGSSTIPYGYYFKYENLVINDVTGINIEPGDVVYFEDPNGCESERIEFSTQPSNLVLTTFGNKYKLTGILPNEPYKLYNNTSSIETKSWDGVGLPEIIYSPSFFSLSNGFVYAISISQTNFNEKGKKSNSIAI